MIKNVSNISFGTNIQKLQGKVKEARGKNFVTDENIDVLTMLKNDGLETSLDVNYDTPQAAICVSLDSPSISKAKSIINEGLKSSFVQYAAYNEVIETIRDEIQRKDDPVSRMAEHGLCLNKNDPSRALMDLFTKKSGIVEAIKNKEERFRELLLDYKIVTDSVKNQDDDWNEKFSNLFA